MQKPLILFYILQFAVIANAFGATCKTGYLLQEDGSCTQCNPANEFYYCPDENTRLPCPEETHDRQYYSDISGHTFNGWITFFATALATSKQNCFSDMGFITPEGKYVAECSWNGVDYYGGCNGSFLWTTASAGYYLSKVKSYNSNYTYYHGVKPCTNKPEKSYYTGPGTPDSIDGSVVDANDCPWECDNGYGRHNDECLPLCGAGITKLHAGPYTYNLYADKHTNRVIVVQANKTSCYVNLEADNVTGALNINYNGTPYHAVD